MVEAHRGARPGPADVEYVARARGVRGCHASRGAYAAGHGTGRRAACGCGEAGVAATDRGAPPRGLRCAVGGSAAEEQQVVPRAGEDVAWRVPAARERRPREAAA